MKYLSETLILAASALLIVTSSQSTFAQWSTSPNVNNAICTAAGSQCGPRIVSNGSGAATITWYDNRNGSDYDIYAQTISSSGRIQWTANGVAVCTVAYDQQYPAIVADGSGGVIITWEDSRASSVLVPPYRDIYAQRINSSGAVQWTDTGVVICARTNIQQAPAIASDGSGGAIITWQDYRDGRYADIYAQRINASGAVQWTSDGVAVCTATDDQLYPVIASDGSGGAIMAWQDFRNGSDYNIYAQRINSSGAIQWTDTGVVICTAAHDQAPPTIVSDGSGGAIITWSDHRNGSDGDIYAQRINASGAVQWTANGVAVCTAAYNQEHPTIVSDGSGGAIIAWEDSRNGSDNDIYAQRINASGAVQWTADGVALCTAAYSQEGPAITSDGSGGAIITWQDARTSTKSYTHYDIYAQRIDASGTVRWTSNGVAICTATGDHNWPVIVSDGLCGAIITWLDLRNGNSDIYAAEVNPLGVLGVNPYYPSIRHINDIANDQGGKVRITWDKSHFDSAGISPQITSYGLWRRIPNGTSSSKSAPSHRLAKAANDTLGTLYDFITNVPAVQSPTYNVVAQTLSDSTSAGNYMYTFLVTAHTMNPNIFYMSQPDSGYSVDNLPPMCPAGSSINPLSGGPVQLSWSPNRTDRDLSHYSVYRSLTSGFMPSAANRLRTTIDTTVMDSSTTPGNSYFYRITAVDIHENESTPTSELSAIPLAVELTALAVSAVERNTVVLEWRTATEKNNAGFEVQRRRDNAGQWSILGFVEGAGTSNIPHTYNYRDRNLQPGTYYYRLRQVSANRASAYTWSTTVTVAPPVEYSLYQNYPNPFNPTTTIDYDLAREVRVRLMVYDNLGRLARRLVDAVQPAGYYKAVFDAKDLSAGVYYYRIQAGDFLKVRKMLVVK